MTSLRNVDDDVVAVYGEDKNHYRQAKDKRTKPTALESKLLLVVLDRILAHIERPDCIAHARGHPPVGLASLRNPATTKEHHIGIEYRSGDALYSEARDDTKDECVITVRIELFSERGMRAELWFKPPRVQRVMEERQHPQEHRDRNHRPHDEHDEGDRDFLCRGNRLIPQGYKRHAHQEAIEPVWPRLLRLLFVLSRIYANLLVEQQCHETLHVRSHDVPDVIPLRGRQPLN